MNISELAEFIRKEGIREDAVSINTVGYLDHRYCIEQMPHGKWVVYYAERGQRFGLKEFPSESLACEYLRDILIEDRTTRVDVKMVRVGLPPSAGS